MGPVFVVVVYEHLEYTLQLCLVQNEQPVETLRANGAHEPLGHLSLLKTPFSLRSLILRPSMHRLLIDVVRGNFGARGLRSSVRLAICNSRALALKHLCVRKSHNETGALESTSTYCVESHLDFTKLGQAAADANSKFRWLRAPATNITDRQRRAFSPARRGQHLPEIPDNL
jgi:hypothetical protein